MLTTLTVQPTSDVDQEELDQLTDQLRRRLLEDLDVDTVDTKISSEAAPDSAKSAAASVFGTLALTLSPVTLHSMFQVIQTWVKNRPVRTVNVTIGSDKIEVSHLTTVDQHRLIESFIERHAAG